MSWRIVYIENAKRVSVYLDNLKVRLESNEELLVSLSDIHSIVIDNPKTVLTVQLINRCTQYNVNIVVCDLDHTPQSIILPHAGHHASAKMLRNQILWGSDRKKQAQSEIVRRKILNQIQACNIVNVDTELINFMKLNSYVDQVEHGDKTNREGLAAKVYFGLMYGNDFYRFDNDSINGALNYGYAIFRSYISKVLVAKGLNTQLGLFHKGPENSFNLSDDVIEVFRPIVDVWVHKNIDNNEPLSVNDRKDLVRLAHNKVLIDGKKQTIFNAMTIYVDSIVRYMEHSGDILFPSIDLYDL